MIRNLSLVIIINILCLIFVSKVSYSFEIIRDTELEKFTNDILEAIDKDASNDLTEIKVFFIKSNDINAFVTAGNNIFINTELFIAADDYREFAAVIAHELAHIVSGHVFSTSNEISNLSKKALPIYLLGIISIMTGASDAGLAGIMVGQASVADSYTYYSRTQEASADQRAIKILCDGQIDGKYLSNFLKKLDKINLVNSINKPDYRSTHPSAANRQTWIDSTLKNIGNCDYEENQELQKRFNLLKAKLFGFTHPFEETIAMYNSSEDEDLYATAVANYFKGKHQFSIDILLNLIKENPSNPYYYELIGEIYFANQKYNKAIDAQSMAIDLIKDENDLYLMMYGNYLLSVDKNEKSMKVLKKSLIYNPKNSYTWYLLARAYAEMDNLALANYATAERYFLLGQRSLSYNFAKKAIKNVEQNSPEWYRSKDLIEIMDNEKIIN